MIGDKSVCKIVSYIEETRTFIVQEIVSQIQGSLPLSKDLLNDKVKLFDAMKQGKTIPLICINVVKGKPIFSSNMHALNEKAQEEQPSISIKFSSENETFNLSLFDFIYSLLGDTIDNDNKFDLAKQLIVANRKFHFRPSLYKELFCKCNGKYSAKMWKENLISYTSNSTIANLWKTGDATNRQLILKRLGISLPEPEIRKIETTKEIEIPIGSIVPLFENIANYIINRINEAESSVKIAVAWFTNLDLFNCIKATLNRNIKVILVMNNDLINNGGYCLNFDELIDCGLILHLVEYPEMLHYKFCIIDDSTIITGSYNWTFYAEEINKEDVVVIDKLPTVTEAFVDRFNMLLEQFKQVSKMPAIVPNRPQYDRGSFKQYISEELILRAKKNIGDRKQNLIKAQTLYPENSHIAEVIKEFGITLDNSLRSIAEIDHDATQSAIEERVQTRNALYSQREIISQRSSDIASKKNEMIQQNEELHRQVVTQLATAGSDEQRVAIQKQSAEHEAALNLTINQIEMNQRETEAEIISVGNQINALDSEIDIIDKTSNIESIGGRGGLKITLKWNTIDDLDLHVIDPAGQTIYYNQKKCTCQNIVGCLDIDANARPPYITTPVENIYWEGTAPIGKYRVLVNLFTKRSDNSEILFTVTIYPEKGESKTFTNKVMKPKEPVSITEFNYSDNGIEYIKCNIE